MPVPVLDTLHMQVPPNTYSLPPSVGTGNTAGAHPRRGAEPLGPPGLSKVQLTFPVPRRAGTLP